jgi:hypothetical protein
MKKFLISLAFAALVSTALAVHFCQSALAQESPPPLPTTQDLISPYNQEYLIYGAPIRTLLMLPEEERLRILAETPTEAQTLPAAPQFWYPDIEYHQDMVFQSYRDETWEIYRAVYINSPTPELQRLTFNAAYDGEPRFNRGCTRIVFTSNRDGNSEIYAMNADGTDQVRLTWNDTDDYSPTWSFDGTKIAFASQRDGNNEIYVMDADGSDQRRLTFTHEAEIRPTLSPDGTQIAWIHVVDGQHGVIVVAHTDGTNAQWISPPLRFLGNLTWAPNSARLAFDYDSDGNFWPELGIIDADGSNLRNIFNPGPGFRVLAGSWSVTERDLYISKVAYVLYQGQLYIYSVDTLRVSLSGIGTTTVFADEFDFSVDVKPNDISPPTSRIYGLPLYSGAGTLSVPWTAFDSGPAGVLLTEFQFRFSPTDEWTTRTQIPQSDPTPLSFEANAGETVYFRSRAQDNAGNWEAWRPETADAFTNVYDWQLFGRITDNRGKTVPQVSVITQPVFSDQTNADKVGQFHRYVPWSPVSVRVSKSGYGALPESSLSSTKDFQYWWILPPADNRIKNGDFESGLNSWLMADNYLPSLDSDSKYTGSASVAVGQIKAVKNVQNLTQNPGRSFMPRAVQDVSGNIHLMWRELGSNPTVNYSYKPVTGTWTIPTVVQGIQLPEMALASDGTLHTVWELRVGDDYGIRAYYAYRTPEGSWSKAHDLFGLKTFNPSSGLKVAVDSQNRVHVTWSVQDGLWYSNRPQSGTWSVPLKLTEGAYHAIAVSPDDVLHLTYAGFQDGASRIFYKSRSAGGAWSSPHTVPKASPETEETRLALAADAEGSVHLLWRQGFADYHSERAQTSQWSTPVRISGECGAWESVLTTDGSNAHIMWRGGAGLCYRRQFAGTTWSPIVQISSTDSLDDGISILPQGDHIRAVWTEGNWENSDLMFGEWDLPPTAVSSLVQVVNLPANLHRPTLSFLHYTNSTGSGGSFSININDTSVYSTSKTITAWKHEWVDLSSWLGQTVTLTLSVHNDLSQGHLTAHVDDISLGSWHTPAVYSVEPDNLAPWTATPITIKGENFVTKASVRVNGKALTDIEWIDEKTLRGRLPNELGPGIYDIHVINPSGHEGVGVGQIRVGKQLYLPLIIN